MTGIIILAAGASTRFGSPKQLAEFRGKALLRHAAETALAARLGPVTVVLGAVDRPCREVLSGLPLGILHNPDWRSGMAGSVTTGLRPWIGSALDGVIIALADQPRLTAKHFEALEAASPTHAIVASRYLGQMGVPAWFSWETFDDLMKLQGSSGGKAVISREPRTHWLEMPAAAFDIDTPSDLLELSGKLPGKTRMATPQPSLTYA